VRWSIARRWPQRPALLGEWDTEANDGLDPAVVTLGSGRRVWWRCASGHRWQTKVDARARSGSRCPLCARRRASPENNLAVTHPEVAALWHPDRNEGLGAAGVLAGSKRRVWWRCEAGHEWQARIDRSVDVRARHDSHCVLCMGWRASPENNLAVTHPEVAAQWHPDRNGELSPGAVLAGSKRRVWWQCEAGHEWQTKVCSRVARGSSCPMCRGQRVSATHNLAAVEPTVAATWHPTRNGQLTAAQVTPRSGVRVWWQCEAGHEWQMAVYHRVNRGCPFCSRRRVTEETSVAALHPEWLPQWHPTRNGELTPDQVLVGSPRALWWRCEVCRHDWVASAAARAHTGSGCQVCARANYRRAEAPLTVTHPAVAATWHPTANGAAVPEEVTYGSDRRVWWRCEAGHEWQTTVNKRTTGMRCPYCAGKLASPERNLAVVRPDFARQWHPTRNGSLTPAEVTPTSSVVEVWWQCEAGHEWAATPASRVQARRCPGCVAAPANNLAVALPAVAAQWHPERNGTLTPRDVAPRARRTVWWRCPDCLHEWCTAVTDKGESPGQWMGFGLDGLGSVAVDSGVSEAQMKALFGEGRHPDADAITQALIAEGKRPATALAATQLGVPFKVFEGATEFRTVVAQRFVAHNVAAGRKGNATIADEVRARIRTEVGTELFGKEYGRPPFDERELSGFARGSRQATTAVAGYDLTFSPVKSVSTLWALAPREVGQQIEAAHQAAVADVIGWLEANAAYTRLGTNGVRQVDTEGLIGAVFTHRDSRAGDPDLHTHVAISNKVQTRGTDGILRWLALDGRVIHKAAVAASERYNTRLEAHLVDRLGVSFAQRSGTDPSKRVVREVVGVDEALSGVWSARRASIDTRRAELAAAFQAAHGRAPSAVEALALAQQATLETRDAKHEPRSHAEQRQQWRTEAVDVLGGEPQLTAMIHTAVPAAKPQMSARVDEEWINQTAEAVIRIVSDARATWQPDHIRAEAERAARATGVKLGELDDTVDAIVTAALGAGVSVPLSAPAWGGVAEPAALRRADGASVYTTARTQLYTSRAVMNAEARLLAAAQRTDGRVTSSRAVDMALLETAANGVELNPGQAALVRELATSGARLQVALAPAGTGKTTAMSALARAWTEDGGHVVGLAPTAAAAAVLGGDLHAPTDTVDKLAHVLGELGDPDRADAPVRVPQWVADIGPETLVIVDEAAMSGTPTLDTAVAYVLGRGGSVRLVGDNQQLASVSAGGVVRDIADTVGAVTLSEVMRFHDPAEGAASLAIRAGDPAGIGYYIDNNRVRVGDPTTVLDQAYAGWAADRAAGLDAVMLAPTTQAVTALNDRARTDRLAAQDTPPGREVTLRTGSSASAGDMITTRRNDRRLVLTANDWVRNGDRWTVRDVGADGSVRAQHVGTNRVITLPANYVADQVELGYARTVHSGQGLTADTAHSVATGEESRQLLYVAMTRGRGSNQLYVQTTGGGDPHSVITPDGLRPPTAVDVLTRIVGYDGAQRSAHTTARDLADPVTLLEHAAGSYEDAVAVAAETVVGPEVLAAIDTAAEDIEPGLRAAPAYPSMRAHLAIISLTGRDPDTALRTAAQVRELATADDVAAVLDWRLDTTGRHSGKTTPLPWLPGLPAPLAEHPQWGPYLMRSVGCFWKARLQQRLAGQHSPLQAFLRPTDRPCARWSAGDCTADEMSCPPRREHLIIRVAEVPGCCDLVD